MARRTFICYKYSESKDIRDGIIDALGDDASYYHGETSDSPDLTDTSTENIKRALRDMIHGTSVTIVIVSPGMIDSSWIDWEIEYSLKEITRDDRTSRTNGVVCVIAKVNGGYGWIKESIKKEDGCTVWSYDPSKLYAIINNNRYNLIGENRFTCKICKCYNMLLGSYMSLVEEGDFIKNPEKYIENAYDKAMNVASYTISKQK